MAAGKATQLFERIALIGVGGIGSSLARVVKRDGLAGHIAVCARSSSRDNGGTNSPSAA